MGAVLVELIPGDEGVEAAIADESGTPSVSSDGAGTDKGED